MKTKGIKMIIPKHQHLIGVAKIACKLKVENLALTNQPRLKLGYEDGGVIAIFEHNKKV